jgi:hypothetical protein
MAVFVQTDVDNLFKKINFDIEHFVCDPSGTTDKIIENIRKVRKNIQPLVLTLEQEKKKTLSLKDIQFWVMNKYIDSQSDNQKVFNKILDALFQALHIRVAPIVSKSFQCELTGIFNDKVRRFIGFKNGIDVLAIWVAEKYAEQFQRIWNLLIIFEYPISLTFFRRIRFDDINPNIHILVPQSDGSFKHGWKFAVVNGQYVFEHYVGGLAILCEYRDETEKLYKMVPISLLQEEKRCC